MTLAPISNMAADGTGMNPKGFRGGEAERVAVVRRANEVGSRWRCHGPGTIFRLAVGGKGCSAHAFRGRGLVCCWPVATIFSRGTSNCSQARAEKILIAECKVRRAAALEAQSGLDPLLAEAFNGGLGGTSR